MTTQSIRLTTDFDKLRGPVDVRLEQLPDGRWTGNWVPKPAEMPREVAKKYKTMKKLEFREHVLVACLDLIDKSPAADIETLLAELRSKLVEVGADIHSLHASLLEEGMRECQMRSLSPE